jgi:hypothetical protein
MTTPTLNAGTFLLFNIHTSRYIYADSLSQTDGSPAFTRDRLIEEYPDANRFVVTNVDGKYSFLNVFQKVYLAPGSCMSTDSVNDLPSVVWAEKVFWWDVSSKGLGIWNIHFPTPRGIGPCWSGDKNSAELNHVVSFPLPDITRSLITCLLSTRSISPDPI